MRDFIRFKKFLTPGFIQVLFWIEVVLALAGGVAILLIFPQNTGAIFGALFIMLTGPILARVNCELLIVIFRIHEVLVEIREKL